jgi:hypothetical protein
MLNPFEIRIDTHTFQIKPHCEKDCIMYEVFRGSEKLFTLEMAADGNWKTVEAEVMSVHEALIAEIGDAIMKHYTF